jgi:hypothetical protein
LHSPQFHAAKRLARLRSHALAGWIRARKDATAQERASRWLAAHPSAMAEVDSLWQEALLGRGPLAEWLAAGADTEQWHHDLPLHSLLACHPFPDLPQWTEVPK